MKSLRARITAITTYIFKNEKKKIYYINIGDMLADVEIAEYLNITLQEYQDVLIKHGAHESQGQYNFYKLRGARKAFAEIEPLLVLTKLRR